MNGTPFASNEPRTLGERNARRREMGLPAITEGRFVAGLEQRRSATFTIPRNSENAPEGPCVSRLGQSGPVGTMPTPEAGVKRDA